VKLAHFAAFAPICPVCVHAGHTPEPLVLAHVADRTADDILAGTLHCPGCQHEYPIVDGIPIIVPRLATLLAERGIELLLRCDLDPSLESMIGDAIGPDSWLDMMRQVQSTYMWDGYADLDPLEAAPEGGPAPNAARRCLARLLAIAPPVTGGVDRMLDLGCAGGRTSFDLAQVHPTALVLGLDIQLGLLRMARRAGLGQVSYPRRRIGLVYDRRRFDAQLEASERVDFWACDATALPFRPHTADLCVGLNLLDCVPDPRRLLEGLASVTRPDGAILLATPYDWSTRATPLGNWLGGHSQRAAHHGAGEAFLHALLHRSGAPADSHAIATLTCSAEEAGWPWQTRLHDRSAVHYRTHLIALSRI
jgi:SAM-dependent methyltransferase/uncharacterized protein YbaR (Trm112 family)